MRKRGIVGVATLSGLLLAPGALAQTAIEATRPVLEERRAGPTGLRKVRPELAAAGEAAKREELAPSGIPPQKPRALPSVIDKSPTLVATEPKPSRSSTGRRSPPAAVSSSAVEPPAANEAQIQNGDEVDGKAMIAAAAAQIPSPENPEVRTLRERLLVAQLQRELAKLEETRKELWYYNWMGRGMFVVVHVVLFLALFVAWSEFKNASGNRRQAKNMEQQELKLSLEGIALKSSLQGTVLLAVALAFYFLYVQFVYPIVVV